MLNNNIFSRESDSRIANVRLSLRLLQKPLSLPKLLLSTIKPIDHQAYQPLSLLTIKPINLWSSFVTFKPFSLFITTWLTNNVQTQILQLIKIEFNIAPPI